MKTALQNLWSNKGQGMTEYGLILGLFVAAVVGAMAVMGPRVAALFAETNNKFE